VLGRLRDRLAHRGPDGAGLLLERNVGLGHRRLAVIDPSAAGQQPMVTPDGAHAIVYNGELYNDAELRAQLRASGVRFASTCDAETLLWALATWGERAIDRLRGMFAFAWHDRIRQRLVLTRDPFGIKPLYYWVGTTGVGLELVFASEIHAILDHPHVPIRPDPLGISAYLSTIRTVLSERTMFEGVRAVRPGQRVEFDLADPAIAQSSHQHDATFEPISTSVRDVIEDAVRRHMRTDVPLCCLLSGGLDSSIIVSVARHHVHGLQTYCAGAPSADADDDLHVSPQVARELGVAHHCVDVPLSVFVQQWPRMVDALGVPLSTPNEVAINAVARRMRADGRVVTLSGEGADELFAGYDQPLGAVRTAFAGSATVTAEQLAQFELAHHSWVAPELKGALFNPAIAEEIEEDEWLFDTTRASFEEALDQSPSMPPEDRAVRAMLGYQRRVNLVGLLGRLDSATMLAAIEGRTPFADRAVQALAESLQTEAMIRWESAQAETKFSLRRAFADVVPPMAIQRAKASFPLPFQAWLEPFGPMLATSEFLGELFSAAAIGTVSVRPAEHWRLAWPMINLAMWGERWWGAHEKRPGLFPGVVEVDARVRISDDGGSQPMHRSPAAQSNSGTG